MCNKEHIWNHYSRTELRAQDHYSEDKVAESVSGVERTEERTKERTQERTKEHKKERIKKREREEIKVMECVTFWGTEGNKVCLFVCLDSKRKDPFEVLEHFCFFSPLIILDRNLLLSVHSQGLSDDPILFGS